MEVAWTKDIHCPQTPSVFFEARIGQAAPTARSYTVPHLRDH